MSEAEVSERIQVGALADTFINEVADWLQATNDPRLNFTGHHPRINNLASACADFCQFMGEVTESGEDPRQWREYLKRRKV